MENKYSLTFPQKNIWLVEEFFGSSPINTIVGIFNIKSEFNFEKCEKAVNKMVQLNEALRLQVAKDRDSVYQYVQDYKYFNVDFFEAANSEQIDELNNKLMVTPFTVIDSPLYYFAVVKTENDTGYIFVKLHHLIADAWTYGNIATDLAEYLDASEDDLELKEKKPSYIDFIEVEKEYIASERFVKDREFWKQYLEGTEETVGLKENDYSKSQDAKRYSVTLDEELNSLIKGYCKVNRISPYTVFMNALAIYMHRVTEKIDFVIGTPILNRANFKEKKMMGMFVSTMPVRFKIDEKTTFLEMCKASASESMTLFRHQKYPYSLMLQDFRDKNNIKSNLYNVMVSYQNARAEYEKEDKYSTNWLFSTKIQNQLEIHIMDMDETGVLQVHFDYLTELFEDIEIEYIAKRLFKIIKDGIVNDKTIETIEIMPEEEKNKILYEFNNTKMDYPKDKTVIDLFEEQVEKTPDNIAVVFEGKELTYKELNEKANCLAWYLKEKGINEKDNVAITLDKSIELMVSILGVLKVGACYVPIDTSYTINRKKYIFEDANCKINIIENFEDENIFDNWLNIKEFKFDKKSHCNIQRSSDYRFCDSVYIMYTSGTTGAPKGTIITNRNIVRLVKNTNYIDFMENDKIIQTGATVFDACTFEYWGALLNGLTLYLLKKESLINPETLRKFLRENKITIMFITTALFNQMIEFDKTIFSTLRVLLTGGEVMSVRHVNIALEHSPHTRIANIYGPTENTTFSNFCYLSGKQEKRVPIGQPINNTVNYIVDSKLRLLPLFVEGELVLGGDGVSKGYLNNPKLTNERFVKSPYVEGDVLYRTGDISLMQKNGYIDFIGRRDNQVKIRGFRIELDEIKNVVRMLENIKDVAVIVRVVNEQKRICVYFTSEIQETISNILLFLKSRLPIYMVPSYIIQVNELPLTQNGKIDIKKLEQIELKENDYKESYEYEGVYKDIYELYCEILKIQNIAPYDNFFDLGGDSILAIQLVTQAMSKNIIITYADLYKYGSIQELGEMIEKNNVKKSISSDIKNIDYTNIDSLLQNNIFNEQEKFNCETHEIKDMMLVGATGFLGAHILYDYLKNYTGKVYCLMRGKNLEREKERLIKRLEFFFGKDEITNMCTRIEVVLGDITDSTISELKIKEIDNITTVINSAACVKHFGSIEYFKRVNEYGPKNLAEFCKINNKRLIHISTLSVSGNILETGQIEQVDIKPDTLYNETNLYIGQNLDNVYAYSKFMGEKVIYDYILEGLDAKIMRMGNLTGRSNDGKFQPNVEENAFANRLKTIIEMGVLPDNILSFYLEFTPIDYAARAVMLLSQTGKRYNTYHIFNHKHAQMTFVDKVFNKMNINLKHITKKQMTELLEKYMSQEDGYQKIQGLILDINKNKEIEYKPNTIVKSDFTIEMLRKLNFEWLEITEDYIIRYMEYLYNIGFLKGDKK
ncbi:MAG: amino acid adenylation domain-containing protein [Clostridia bacterium]|nr:amino acid adenylation domain-containing protein [Clostridia bacterium]